MTATTAPQPAATAVPRAEPTVVPTAVPFQRQPIHELGGSLVIAVKSPSQRSARSWMMDAFSANALVRPFAEPLLHTDRFDGSIVPGLATGWELSSDGRSWVFHLRQGVAFHRGWGEFTAHDVIHSASLLVRDDALDFGIPTFRELFGQTQGGLRGNITLIDDYTVEFTRPTRQTCSKSFQLKPAISSSTARHNGTAWVKPDTPSCRLVPVLGNWRRPTWNPPSISSTRGSPTTGGSHHCGRRC